MIGLMICLIGYLSVKKYLVFLNLKVMTKKDSMLIWLKDIYLFGLGSTQITLSGTGHFTRKINEINHILQNLL